MQLPHEQYPKWISPEGVIAPGDHVLTDPLFVPADYLLRARAAGRVRLIAPVGVPWSAVTVAGALYGVNVVGGRFGIEIQHSSWRASVENCTASGASAVQIYVQPCIGARIARVIVDGSPDNGLQIDGGDEIEIHSCAFVGYYGNKAIDASHGVTRKCRIVHCTVVATNNYGVGLGSWRPDSGNAMVNCAVYVPQPGPGSNGYAIHTDAGSLLSNVTGTTFGTVGRDFPSINHPGLSWCERLRPAASARMFSASWRTLGSRDLDGKLRIPWRGALAVGAVASS